MTSMEVSASPRVLIAESDHATREILSETVLKVRSDAVLEVCEDGNQAVAVLQRYVPELVLAARELPGVNGLELLRDVRQKRSRPVVPFILLSDRNDAASVREAIPLAPTAYLMKPLNIDSLRQRLETLLNHPEQATGAPPTYSRSLSLSAFLERRREDADGGPLRVDVRAAVQHSRSGNDVDGKRLERELWEDPHVTAVLIAAANSAGQHGRSVVTSAQAISVLGPAQSANLVLGLAAKRSATLTDPMLLAEAERFWMLSLRTARYGELLARKLGLKPDLCHCAGLLLCIGDLTLLRCLQEWVSGGGMLDETAMREALEAHAASFGSALRTRWRLPLSLRELISAGYQYNMGASRLDILAMNLAGLLARLDGEQGLEAVVRSKPARLLKIDAEEMERLREAGSVAAPSL